MRLPILQMIIVVIVNLLIDYYLWWRLRRHEQRHAQRNGAHGKGWLTLSMAQLWSAIIINASLIVFVSIPRRHGSDAQLITIMWALFSYLTIYVSKIIAFIFDSASLAPRIWKGRSWRRLSITGTALAGVTFCAMWWGALVTRKSIEVKELNVAIPNLPAGFDGYRIAQISDWHVGSYGTDTTYVSDVVDRLNHLDVDLIVFTGDIVNRHAPELHPFVSTLSRLHAPDGVYAILGNHDYGDYHDWPTADDKRADRADLLESYGRTGWELLLNESRWLRSGNDSIALIGVENIGDPPFPVYGSLRQAYATPGDSVIKILLTHNPAHWADSIADNSDTNIALTLSGHTHAMQIEIGSWSPAEWRYPTWGGLYSDSRGAQLYVNTGLGTVALPMRIGVTPEITILNLISKP